MPALLPKISAVIIAQNEEAHIAAAVQSVGWADEILVVDGGSTDGTKALAEEAGARIIERPFDGYLEQKRFGTSEASHDWIFSLDSDERCTDALAMEIGTLRSAGFQAAGYRIPRLSRYLGKTIRGTEWYPDHQLRLFDRNRGGWQGHLVHESVQVQGPVVRLNAVLDHYPYKDIADHMRKLNRYSTLAARQMHAASRKSGLAHVVLLPPLVFLKNFVLKLGCFQGLRGLIISILNAVYVFLKYVKLWELARRD